MKRIFLLIVLNIVFVNSAGAFILSGPTLTNNADGWNDTGLSITALENVILKSFVFNNQGAADTLWLYDADGILLQTYNYSGDDLSHLVDASWSLSAGQTYALLADQPSNGKWEAYPDFPLSNEHLRINSSRIKSSEYALLGYWFNFTDFTTSDLNESHAIPEPTTVVLFGSGLLGAFLRRKFV